MNLQVTQPESSTKVTLDSNPSPVSNYMDQDPQENKSFVSIHRRPETPLAVLGFGLGGF